MSKFKHVAIIMDGNGRWAKQRHRPREWGHIRGSRVVPHIVEEANQLGINVLTFYSFSTENWLRPKREISTLFSLLKKFLLREEKRILKNQIVFKIIGDISGLPEKTQEIIQSLEEKSKKGTGLKLCFAFNYGSKSEIIKAANNWISKFPGKELTINGLEGELDTKDLGAVDLVIRTSGEQRLSNFLLWQCAYAEFYFTKTLWPEFTRKEFSKIIKSVSSRERRFGGIETNI